MHDIKVIFFKEKKSERKKESFMLEIFLDYQDDNPDYAVLEGLEHDFIRTKYKSKYKYEVSVHDPVKLVQLINKLEQFGWCVAEADSETIETTNMSLTDEQVKDMICLMAS